MPNVEATVPISPVNVGITGVVKHMHVVMAGVVTIFVPDASNPDKVSMVTGTSRKAQNLFFTNFTSSPTPLFFYNLTLEK